MPILTGFPPSSHTIYPGPKLTQCKDCGVESYTNTMKCTPISEYSVNISYYCNDCLNKSKPLRQLEFNWED